MLSLASGIVTRNSKLGTVAGRMRLRRNCLNRKWQEGRTIVNCHPRGRTKEKKNENPKTSSDEAQPLQPLSFRANAAANHGHNHNYIRSDNGQKQFEREASQLQFELTMAPRKIASFRRSYFIFISGWWIDRLVL